MNTVDENDCSSSAILRIKMLLALPVERVLVTLMMTFSCHVSVTGSDGSMVRGTVNLRLQVGNVKLRRIGPTSPQHAGSTTGLDPVILGSVRRVFINLIVPYGVGAQILPLPAGAVEMPCRYDGRTSTISA